MKQRLIIIGVLTVLAVGTLYALNISSDASGSQKNGFIRQFVSEVSLPVYAELAVPAQVIGICAIYGDTVFLQTRTPGLIYYTSDFKRLDTIRLQIPPIPKMQSLFFTEVQYPVVYIIGGNARKVIRGNVLKGAMDILDVNTPGSFSHPVFLSDHEMVVRCIDSVTYDALFYKVDLISGSAIREQGISEHLGDAGFIHDGMLGFDITNKQLAYVDYYSNNVTMLDESLHLLKKFNTIDTHSVSGMVVHKGKGSITNKLPPRMVNGINAISEGTLYVMSRLKGDNETDMETVIPIDRYNTSTGEYVGSFYLPFGKKQMPLDFIIKGNALYVLTSSKLIQLDVNNKLILTKPISYNH